MNKYICKNNQSGYEYILKVDQVYEGKEREGIFPGDHNKYLIVFNEKGNQLCAAHLSRFELVEE